MFVMLMVICTGGVFSAACSTPVAVAEYPTLAACQSAADEATYTIRRHDWKPFNDGAICVRKGSAG